MKIEIVLKDEQGFPTLMVSSCQKDHHVNIKLLNDTSNTNVDIDHLRVALRKIVAK